MSVYLSRFGPATRLHARSCSGIWRAAPIAVLGETVLQLRLQLPESASGRPSYWTDSCGDWGSRSCAAAISPLNSG
jgi:hypothetical protein